MEKVRLYCEIHTSNIRRIENKYATYHNVYVILITSNANTTLPHMIWINMLTKLQTLVPFCTDLNA